MNINDVDNYFDNCLMRAACQEGLDLETVKFLIEDCKINIYHKNKKGLDSSMIINTITTVSTCSRENNNNNEVTKYLIQYFGSIQMY